MPDNHSATFTLTQSLSGKFFLTALTVVVLFVSAYGVAISALNTSAADNRLLAENHMKTLQDAQLLLQQSMMIEHQTQLLLSSESNELEKSYKKILGLLDSVDTMVASLGHTTSGTAILDLHQISQVYRNSIHIIARLRSEILNPDTSPERLIQQKQALESFKQQQNKQIEALIITAEEFSSRISYDYHQAVEELALVTGQRQQFVLSIFLFCVIVILLIGIVYRRNTVVRLQKISLYLSQEQTHSTSQKIPVGGHDEIGEMARSIEKLQNERNSLIKSHKPIEEKE